MINFIRGIPRIPFLNLRNHLILVLSIVSLVVLGQKGSISGTVVDLENVPIIGVNIIVKGTTNGTVTNLNGEYSLEVPAGEVHLTYSFIGYLSEDVILNIVEGKDTVYNVVLIEDLQQLEEVVVIGYGTQKKVDLTGAVSTISTEDINSIPVANAVEAIQGKAAGVYVSKSGAPGGGLTIKIRGTGTINNSDPLYVVDGMIVEDINHVTPDDIKDLQILKDASASAIYGARAANGVVLITTKSGDAGKTRVNFNAYYGESEVWNTPELMDKYEYVEMWEAAYPGQNYFEQNRQLVFDQFAADSWYDRILRTAITQKYNLQVSGGKDKNTFLVSGSWMDEEGTVRNSGYSKATVRANMINHLNDKIQLTSNIQFISSDRDRISEYKYGTDEEIFVWATYESPATSIYDENYMVFSSEGDLISNEKVFSWNPYKKLIDYSRNDILNQQIGNFQLNIDIIKGLKNKTLFGLNHQLTKTEYFGYNRSPDYTYMFYSKYDDNAVYNEDVKEYKWQIENISTYSKKLGGHNLNLIGGIVFEGYDYKVLWASRAMAPGTDDSYHALMATYLNPNLGGYSYEWKAIGIPFRVDYNFKSKYLLQLNFRADASSIFTSKKRWGYFPSISGGWKISEESFLKSSNWLTLLKLRASWGSSGNNRIDEYASKTLIYSDNSQYYVYGRDPVYRPGWSANSIGNEDIVWEKTTSVNAGVDLSAFRGSLYTTIEVFDKKTTDMLIRLPVVLSTGMGYGPWQNAGEVNNRGIELTIGVKRNIKDFSFDINGNCTRIVNKVTKLGEIDEPINGGQALDTYVTHTEVGMPIGMFYGWVIDKSFNENGIWQEKDLEEITRRKLPGDRDPEEYIGDFIFKDLNGDNKIDENDKTYIGNPHPDIMYGLNLTFGYKALDLTIFFQGIYGNDIFNINRYWMYTYRGDNNTVTGLKNNVYTAENETAPYPKTKTGPDYNQNFRASDFYIEDGSYLRLKNLQLGFNFPDKLCNKLHLSKFRLYIGGYNLLTFTKYKGFDPEINNTDWRGYTDNTSLNMDRGTYPVSRTFMGGLIIGF